jgi:hypothetical protein
MLNDEQNGQNEEDVEVKATVEWISSASPDQGPAKQHTTKQSTSHDSGTLFASSPPPFLL